MNKNITARMIAKTSDKYGRTAYEVKQTTGGAEDRWTGAEMLGKIVKLPNAAVKLNPNRAWLFNNWKTEQVAEFATRKELMNYLGLNATAKQDVWHAV